MPGLSGIIAPTTAEATGRRTLNDLVDELARPINADSDNIRAIAGDAIRAAIRAYNRKGLWPWERQEQDLLTTLNVNFTTVVGAIKKPLSMHFLDGVNGTPWKKLEYVEYHSFLEKYAMNIVDEPRSYTIPNLFETGQIRWFPTPAASYPARFDFYRVTPSPRAETDPVEIPDFVTEAYMSRAWYEFVKRLPQNQRPFSIDFAKAEADQAFREISAQVGTPGDVSRQIGPLG